MRKSSKNWLWVVVLVFGTATVGKAVLNELFDDFKGRGEAESWKPEEARRRGILVTELIADPPVLNLPAGRIHFGPAWIEERSLPTHRFVWIPVEERIGGYRLHFTIDRTEGIDAFDLRHWASDPRHHVLSIYSQGKAIHCIQLERPEASAVRINFAQTLDDPRAGSVRFVPKQ